jgi:hypothetical protein
MSYIRLKISSLKINNLEANFHDAVFDFLQMKRFAAPHHRHISRCESKQPARETSDAFRMICPRRFSSGPA